MSYHTVELHKPHVYHDREDCPDGKDIKKGNRREGPGTGRTLCKECAKMAKPK